MHNGKNIAYVNWGEPTKVEVDYDGAGYVEVGEYAAFDISFDPVTKPSDPDGSEHVLYYRVSIKFELMQTGEGEVETLYLNYDDRASIKATYQWGYFEVDRTYFDVRLVAGLTYQSDGVGVLPVRATFAIPASALYNCVVFN